MQDHDAEKLGSFLLLQLAQIGFRMEYIVAQFIASYLHSAEFDHGLGAPFQESMFDIEKNVVNLLTDPSNVWDGLLPGGPGIGEQFLIISADSTEPTAHEPNGIVDEYTYLISIIIDPRIRHDETNNLIEDAQKVTSTSPLNLAQHVWDRIDRIDKTGKWPAEELSAWITHRASDQDFLMTFDQAEGLLSLEKAQIRLELHDMDDMFQAEYEQMSIAGREYVGGKEFHQKQGTTDN